MTFTGIEPAIVLCVTDDAATGLLVHELLATAAPAFRVQISRHEDVEIASLDSSDCLLLDCRGVAAIDVLRRYRARGTEAHTVLIVEEKDGALEGQSAALGAPVVVGVNELGAELPLAVLNIARTHMLPERWREIRKELRRTQSQVALGQLAAKLIHDLSNPLTVIATEAQMLERDANATDSARATAREIVGMSRRMAALLRDFGTDDTED